MTTVQERKAALRTQTLARLADLSQDALNRESRSLIEALKAWVAPRGFSVVLATLPLPGEPDLTPFLQFWLTRGRVALAKTGPGRTLEFRYVRDLEGPWVMKSFGLKEPPETAPLWTPGPPTVALVPGLAFAQDPHGGAWRLGRGAGYYDRWLARHRGDIFSLGIGLSVQETTEVPIEPHDQKLDGWLGSGSTQGP